LKIFQEENKSVIWKNSLPVREIQDRTRTENIKTCPRPEDRTRTENNKTCPNFCLTFLFNRSNLNSIFCAKFHPNSLVRFLKWLVLFTKNTVS
jgi:hypothetical protein